LRQLDVALHDCDAVCVDGAEIDIFKETHEVSLRGFLECGNNGLLEAGIAAESGGNLAD
jgi:hypothetical protein